MHLGDSAAFTFDNHIRWLCTLTKLAIRWRSSAVPQSFVLCLFGLFSSKSGGSKVAGNRRFVASYLGAESYFNQNVILSHSECTEK
jgi:hypothetical protein